MGDDTQQLIGKWTVWVKDWVWEYEFFPNGTVTWRDTRSYEKGTGRWFSSPQLINLFWNGSSTKESWKRPLVPTGQEGWYSSAYYTGNYKIKKVVRPFDLPSWSQPEDTVDIDVITNDPQTQPDYIDSLCTAVAYGIYNGGFYVYVPPPISQYPILVPEKSLWFGPAGSKRVSDTIFDSQAEAIKAVGVINPTRVAYYRGVGGKLVCPTAFTLLTAPTIVNTASLVVDELIEEVKEELGDLLEMLVLQIAISTIGQLIGNAIRVRRLKARDARAKAALQRMRESNANRRGAPRLRPGIVRGADVTSQTIKDAVRNAPLKTQQRGGISLPRVQDYVDKLNSGEVPPPIKVDNGIIVEGNHRYIAGRIVGQEPPIQQWSGGDPNRVVPWDDLKISQEKW